MVDNFNIGGFQFPSLDVPESDKDKNYHKDFCNAIIYRSMNSSYDVDYHFVEQCQTYYNGAQSGEKFNFLREFEDGSLLPAFWVNYNKIASKVDLLVGELIEKGYRIDVSSIDKTSKSRKLDEKENARVDFRLSPYAQSFESEFGIPLQNGNQFSDEEDLDHYYDYEYKEESEMAMKGSLSYSLKECKWDYQRMSLFRDVLITGRCFSKVELINGVPKVRRIDPKFMIFDKNATDDFLSDSTFFGEVRYMNIAEASQKYNISKKDLMESYRNQYSKESSLTRKRTSYPTDNFKVENFTDQDGELRVLVYEVYWVDFKKYVNEFSEDKYGNIHVKTLNDDTKKVKNIKSKNYKIWRKCVLIGGDHVVEHGVVKNMPRSIDDPSDTGCPYKALIPNYINKNFTSISSKLQSLQDLKDISLFNLQVAMSRAGGKGFIYDTSQTPDGWSVEQVLKYLKTAGVAFINSAQNEDNPTTFNQFQRLDLSLGDEVNKYIEISLMVDREMDAITGINEARQGVVQNASQAVGVTQSSLIQSSLTTRTYFELFRQMSSDIFNYMSGLIKISWPENKDRFSIIIGDNSINFLMKDIDLELSDYGVYVEDLPVSIANVSNFHDTVRLMLQSGQLEPVSALKLLKETDVDKGIKILERELQKQTKKAMIASAKEQESASAASQNNFEMEKAKIMMDHELEKDLELSKIDAERESDLAKISSKGKIDAYIKHLK